MQAGFTVGDDAPRRSGSRSRRVLTAAVMAVVGLIAAMAIPASASAAIELVSFDAAVSDATDTPETQAGVHPYQAKNTTVISIDPVSGFPKEAVRDIVVDLPVGFVGDPSDLPTCDRVQLAQLECQPGAQIGTMTVTVGFQPGFGMP